MKKLVFSFFLIACIGINTSSFSQASNNQAGEFYQLTVYHFSTAEQQKIIEEYLQQAYLPALHRQQIKNIGAFTSMANDTATDKRLYILIPVNSLQDVADLSAKLVADNDYQASGKNYLNAGYKQAPYTRMENILLKAFPLAPALTLPKLKGSNSEKVYELRSYESATEKIFDNKVRMFNEGGEIVLFKRLNFNAIFYASVIAGARMPNLMYITSFENMADRDAHWKSFSDDPEWKKLSALPEYQNNVIKNEITFLKATSFSDY